MSFSSDISWTFKSRTVFDKMREEKIDTKYIVEKIRELENLDYGGTEGKDVYLVIGKLGFGLCIQSSSILFNINRYFIMLMFHLILK